MPEPGLSTTMGVAPASLTSRRDRCEHRRMRDDGLIGFGAQQEVGFEPDPLPRLDEGRHASEGSERLLQSGPHAFQSVIVAPDY